jgi:L-ascorbate metabolism protein UlaG (beta-lactamase superfamily)
LNDRVSLNDGVRLTKFGHSCVRFDDGDQSLVIDPGVFSDVDAALDGVQAVLITHEHPDHLDADKLRAALRRDPRLRVWAPASVAASLAEFGEQVVTSAPGESFAAAEFAVDTFGGQHALIHPSIPIVANVAYLVDGLVYHPGDSLIVPPVPVEVLLLPAVAPWSKVSEVIDYAVAVRAPRAFPIHDGIVNDNYRAVLQRNFATFTERFGFEYAAWTDDITV